MREETDAAMPVAREDEATHDCGELQEIAEAPPIVSAEPNIGDAAAETSERAEPEPDPLAEVSRRLSGLTEQAARYHERAAQREAMIDAMHVELEQLRLGERRSLLRPLLTEVCRTRDDLLRQAETLPEPFDREQAAELLRNFAGSLEFALEDNGVTTFVPEVGESFQARLHRAAGKVPTQEESLAGTIANVVSPGYHDIEADAVIGSARVAVYVMGQDDPENDERKVNADD